MRIVRVVRSSVEGRMNVAAVGEKLILASRIDFDKWVGFQRKKKYD